MNHAYAILFSLATLLAACNNSDTTPEPPVLEAPPAVEVSPLEPTPEPEVKSSEPPKPLECKYSGVLILDKGEKKIEMQGCPSEWEVFHPMRLGNADPPDSTELVGRSVIPTTGKTKSVLLKPDKEGRFRSTDMPEGVWFMVLDHQIWGHAPEGEEKLSEVYAVNNYVSNDRKLTPFLSPDMLGPPTVKVEHLQGELVEGVPFHVLPPDQQIGMLIVQ